MASTEQRSGFRLPWSSDKAHHPPADDPAGAVALAPDAPAADADAARPADTAATPTAADPAWPDDDLDRRLGLELRQAREDETPEQESEPEPAAVAEPEAVAEPVAEPEAGPLAEPEPVAEPEGNAVTVAVAESQPEPITQADPAPAAAREPAPAPAPAREPAAPKKSTRLIAELTAAIRVTAEAARDQALAQVDTEAGEVVAAIRGRSKPGEAVLRQRSDAEVSEIREWSKAEIARIKEETEARITARRSVLAEELAAHSAGIERRVGEVQGVADAYRSELASYTERIAGEEDPAKLATLAETMPEPPSLAAWLDFEDGDLDQVDVLAVDATVEAADMEALDVAGLVDEDEPLAAYGETEDETADPADATETEAGPAGGPVAEAMAEPVAGTAAEPEVAAEAVEAFNRAGWTGPANGNGSGHHDGASFIDEPVVDHTTDDARSAEARWAVLAGASAAAPLPSGGFEASSGDDELADVPRWDTADAPEEFPAGGGDPVDRGAIMAALEAAAEAVVAAESAAESADQAEAAAGVAETAAELLAGRAGHDDMDPEAQAAMAARVDAGGFDTESFADRLASLFPGGEETQPGIRTTQVVVTGLVSVASIASFKRHLGRLAGVQSVAVQSGSEGEFAFVVTHAGDVPFKDAIPTLPGFAARVLSQGNGVVTVAARDPEGE